MPIHFIVPAAFCDRLSTLTDLSVGEDYPYWLGGQFNWAAQSFLVLRQWREGVTIGTAPAPRQVNLAHSKTWRTLGRRGGEYRVSARADYPRVFDVDFELLQNPQVSMGRAQAYVPYWPIPGIVPRGPERRSVVTVAYAGRIGSRNLADDLRQGVSDHPAMRGLSFVTIPPDRWHDMSQVDVLVAVRDFSRDPHRSKPPSKLFNAWLAHIPLVAGWDSAFSAIGRPGTDYVRIGALDEFYGSISRLRDDPEHYRAIVAAGGERAKDYSREKVAKAWLAVLDGPVAAQFETWLERGGAERRLHPASALDRGRAHLSLLKQNAAKDLRLILSGRGS